MMVGSRVAEEPLLSVPLVPLVLLVPLVDPFIEMAVDVIHRVFDLISTNALSMPTARVGQSQRAMSRCHTRHQHACFFFSKNYQSKVSVTRKKEPVTTVVALFHTLLRIPWLQKNR
ncbi:MAG: hypothetical protein H7327_02600 [Herminiimonas sp.]|nr:hypothetical protein [Herminiimonas sp.]